MSSIILGNSLLTARGVPVAGEMEIRNVQAMKILEIGNTNSRYRFPIGSRPFVNQWNAQGPAHHCAVGVGHIADKIAKLGELLQLDVVRIC